MRATNPLSVNWKNANCARTEATTEEDHQTNEESQQNDQPSETPHQQQSAPQRPQAAQSIAYQIVDQHNDHQGTRPGDATQNLRDDNAENNDPIDQQVSAPQPTDQNDDNQGDDQE